MSQVLRLACLALSGFWALHMAIRAGLSCPVIVADQIDWRRDYSRITLGELYSLSSIDLAAIDPLAMNLIVARGIPALAGLEIFHYQEAVNDWTSIFSRKYLPALERFFHESPSDFRNDIRYFRMGLLHQFLEMEIGLEYNEDQRDGQPIWYTNPGDLFLNGLIVTRRGTCGNMAALQVSMAWRFGWPVSLACVGPHFVVRFDDGESTWNIEATQSGKGGFKSDPDEYLIETNRLPEIAISSGSDLRALRPHEVLGVFVELRAQHIRDLGFAAANEAKVLESESDWLLARSLFPTNRIIFRHQSVVSSLRGSTLFGEREAGHPDTYGACLDELAERRRQWRDLAREKGQAESELDHFIPWDDLYFQVEV